MFYSFTICFCTSLGRDVNVRNRSERSGIKPGTRGRCSGPRYVEYSQQWTEGQVFVVLLGILPAPRARVQTPVVLLHFGLSNGLGTSTCRWANPFPPFDHTHYFGTGVTTPSLSPTHLPLPSRTGHFSGTSSPKNFCCSLGELGLP